MKAKLRAMQAPPIAAQPDGEGSEDEMLLLQFVVGAGDGLAPLPMQSGRGTRVCADTAGASTGTARERECVIRDVCFECGRFASTTHLFFWHWHTTCRQAVKGLLRTRKYSFS